MLDDEIFQIIDQEIDLRQAGAVDPTTESTLENLRQRLKVRIEEVLVRTLAKLLQEGGD